MLSNPQQEMSSSCTEIYIQNLEKSEVLQVPHALQGTSLCSMLTFMDPMFRLQFSDNIFRVVISVKITNCHHLLQLVIVLHFTHLFCCPLQLCLCHPLRRNKWLQGGGMLRWDLSLMKLPGRARPIYTLFSHRHRKAMGDARRQG